MSYAGVPVSTGGRGLDQVMPWVDRCQIYFEDGWQRAVDDLGWRTGIERSQNGLGFEPESVGGWIMELFNGLERNGAEF